MGTPRIVGGGGGCVLSSLHGCEGARASRRPWLCVRGMALVAEDGAVPSLPLFSLTLLGLAPTRAGGYGRPAGKPLTATPGAAPPPVSPALNPHDPTSAAQAIAWSGVRSSPSTGGTLISRRPLCGARSPRALPTVVQPRQNTDRQGQVRGRAGSHPSRGSRPFARPPTTALRWHTPRPPPVSTPKRRAHAAADQRGGALRQRANRIIHGLEEGRHLRPFAPTLSAPQVPLPSGHGGGAPAESHTEHPPVSTPPYRIHVPNAL